MDNIAASMLFPPGAMGTVAFHDVEPGRAASLRVLQRALGGEVFVLRQLMQRAGIHDGLTAASRAGIERSGCETGRWTGAGAAFDQLHRFVPAGDIPRVATAVQEAIQRVYHDLLARLLREGLGFDRPLYAMSHPIVRFLLPYDAVRDHRAEYQRYGDERGHGKITTLRPHRDSWFAESASTINLWIAVGPVHTGNGLSIYPERYGRPLDFIPNVGVTRSQAVGQPVNFELLPGDVVVFHADHLHASELNRTVRTRHVVSFRVRMSRSFFALRSTERFRSFHPSRPFFARVVDPASRRISRILHRTRPYIAGNGAAADASAISQPAAGTVQAISDELCSIRLRDGTLRVFSRRCPHQGADLALGYLRDGSIVCPWHNLPFDLATGRSPCAAVPPLRMAP
jgi:nitrite reductase/ring-hydroxylating ferredoxin subunit